MASVTLDLACYNLGIQEYSPFNDHLQEVGGFGGNRNLNGGWSEVRKRDGTIIKQYSLEIGDTAR